MFAINARIIAALAAAGLFFGTTSLGLAEEKPIRIGVLNDMSGPYADFQGPGSVLAAQMAVEDYGGKAAGRKVEVVSADHQNKPDVGLGIVRKWIDEDGVDMIADVPNSAVALAVSQLVNDKNKAFIGSGAGTAALTGAQCTPERGAMDLRHMGAWPRIGPRHRRSGQEELVFHRRRLCLRTRPREAGERGGARGRRQGASASSTRRSGRRIFRRSFCRRNRRTRMSWRFGECRRRRRPVGETGRGVRPHPEGDARRIRPHHPEYSGARRCKRRRGC